MISSSSPMATAVWLYTGTTTLLVPRVSIYIAEVCVCVCSAVKVCVCM